jgi:hypothetical protein
VDGNDVQCQDDDRVEKDRSNGVHASQPSAARTLDVKFFKKPDPSADKYGVNDTEYYRTADREGRQPYEQCKDRNGQQNRSELPARRNGDRSECQCHGELARSLTRSSIWDISRCGQGVTSSRNEPAGKT